MFRIQPIIDELGGEKIRCTIPYGDDILRLCNKYTLSPTQLLAIDINDEEKIATGQK